MNNSCGFPKMKTIFITGASSPTGSELLKFLSKQDFRIIAGAFPEEINPAPNWQELCDEVIELDMDSGDSVENAFRQVHHY